MEKKRIYIAILILFALGWAITIGYYAQSQKEIKDLKNGTANITNQEEAFAVCDENSGVTDEQACVDQLVRFSNLLKKYEEKLKTLNVQG